MTTETTASPNNCPVCNAAIPADAPKGMCPRCLLVEGATGSVAETLAGPAPSANLPANLRYVGDYELLDEIARGGMGVVYRAKQASLSRVVAVKMILAGNLADESAVRRFRQEAAAAAALDHPHIVPIYEVGEQEGRHYFSMGYVPGTSLADRLKNGPLPANEAAQLVQTIAEAVQYAHEQGVIHRDLKPANILLDEQGRPRVTDFGLAKVSSQDQSLTKTGQAVGTPGYMPPEQVQNDEIGPTADVYALGAILYALLTGRPPFQAATPLDTMLQVISAEPASPRTLNPAVPRDLETIALKCLEKRTEWRYLTARDLAAELKRFLNNEPITARPPGIVERGWRWLDKQRQGVALVLIAVAASVFALLAGSWTYTLYQQAQLGKFRLTAANHERLAANVLNLQGSEVVPIDSLPTLQPKALPAGEYVVRASDRRLLGDDFIVQIPRGDLRSFDLNLQDTKLMSDVDVAGTWHVLHSPGFLKTAQIVLLSRTKFELRDVKSYDEALQTDLREQPELKALKNFRPWPWINTTYAPSGVGNYDYRPQVIARPPNLDGGERPDVIVAYRHQPVILAMSADSATFLWVYAPESFAANRKEDLGQHAHGSDSMFGAVLGAPLVVPDLDADGTPDLVAAFVHIEPLPTSDPQPTWHEQPRRTIEAISAKTGKRIWQHDLPDQAFLPVGNQEIPPGCLWFPKWPDGSAGGGSTSSYFGNDFREFRINFARDGSQIVIPWPPQLLGGVGKERLVCVAGTSLVELKLNTGEPVRPAHALGTLATREPQFADVTGDGEPELILMEALPDQPANSPAPDEVKLHVRSLATGEHVFPPQVHVADYDKHSGNFHALPQWPVVADLNDDGRAEIVIASGTSSKTAIKLDINLRAWGGLTALAGATGKPLWHRELDAVDQQLDQFLVGPDIDGDGWRELFAATLFSRRLQGAKLYVDALSGKDGSTLWTNHVPVTLAGTQLDYEVIGQLQWWNAGADGWPQLIVPIVVSHSNQPVGMTWFSAGSGAVTRTADGMQQPFLDDLNDDGADDLILFEPEEPRSLDKGGRLSVFRGNSPQPWRALGRKLQAADDYDGDGRDDLLPAHEQVGPRAAISGATGRLLWEGRENDSSQTYHPLHRDFDGDGAADFAGVEGPHSNPGLTTPLRLFSGKTGRLIWAAGFSVSTLQYWAHVSACDLEHDGRPEVAFVAQMDLDPNLPGRKQQQDWQYWLVILDNRGRVRLRQQISGWSHENFLAEPARIAPAFADLNRDGCDDAIVPVLEAKERRFLVAIDGRSLDKPLWKVELPANGKKQITPPKKVRGLPLLGSGDVNGDQTPDLLFHLSVFENRSEYMLQIHARDGRTGEALPGWPLEMNSTDPKLPDDAVQEYSGNPLFETSRPCPQVLDLGGERVVVTWHQGVSPKPGRLLFISSAGKLLWELPVTTGGVFRPWFHDVNGDGQTDCLLANLFGVEAYDLTTRERLWRHELPVVGLVDVLGIEPRGSDQCPVLLIANDRSVFGLAVEDGALVWRSVGLPDDVSPTDRSWQLLRHTDPLQPPFLVAGRSKGDVSCRSFEMIDNQRATLNRTPLVAAKRPLRDPRYARPLPWTTGYQFRPLQLDAPAYLASGFIFALLLIVVPGGLLWQFLRSWRFGLAQLLLVPAVLGLVLLGLQLPVPPAGHTFFVRFERLDLALQMTPVWIATVLIASALARRQWRLPLAGLAVVLLTTLALLAAYLHFDQLGPREFYTSTGWWQVLVLGAYVSAWIITVVCFLVAVARKVREWRKSRTGVAG